MILGRSPPRRIPTNPSADALGEWVRCMAPDLRIRKVRLEDGKRVCGARFTFRGELLEVEAAESPELPDPDDAIVRRCAWLIQRRMGLAVTLDDANRRRLEQEILAARQRGDDTSADALSRELALSNEGGVPRFAAHSRFQDFGGSMFGRTTAWQR